MENLPESIIERAKKVKLLLLDVDGVLTGGEIIITSTGDELKIFSVLDGMGIKLLQKAGVEVAILSSRKSKPVELRAKELGIKRVIQGELEKLKAFEKLLEETSLSPEEVAYIGDDWVDIPVLKRVGLAVAVANAWPPVKEYAHYITRTPGGKGAVREVAEHILKAKGLWRKMFSFYC